MTGRELKRWRENSDLSQHEAAKVPGVSRDRIESLEGDPGRSIPNHFQFIIEGLERTKIQRFYDYRPFPCQAPPKKKPAPKK
jgi:predicted transcriptional regulator